jgi:hypothetical protein
MADPHGINPPPSVSCFDMEPKTHNAHNAGDIGVDSCNVIVNHLFIVYLRVI